MVQLELLSVLETIHSTLAGQMASNRIELQDRVSNWNYLSNKPRLFRDTVDLLRKLGMLPVRAGLTLPEQ